MVATAELVLFAIQAGVRLYAAGRKAYVEATLDRPLLLPLPSGPGISAAAARNFFMDDPQGKAIATRNENERIRVLLTAANAGTLPADGEEELTRLYVTYLCELQLQPDAFKPLSSDEPKRPRTGRAYERTAVVEARAWR